MKVNVAVVLMYFGNGGAENMVAHLVSHLDLSIVNVQVYCIYGKPQKNHLEEEVYSHGVNIVYMEKGLGFSIKAMIKLYRELNKFEPNVVHTHAGAGAYIFLWAMLHRVKVLHTVHSMPEFELGRVKRKIMAVMYRTGKAIPVGISHTIKQLISKMYKIRKQVELVYNPVDISRFTCDRDKNEFKSLFITAGRLEAEKNQELLIRAFKKVVEKVEGAKLIILGEGSFRKKLEGIIDKENLSENINLMGNVNNIETYFSIADIFVLSSNYEGLPLVLLEAMAAGLPIISTNVGGVKDIITDNGILVEANNEEMLAKAMIDICQNEEIRISLSRNAIKNVKQYDINIIARQYEQLYLKYSNKKFKNKKYKECTNAENEN